MNLLPPILPRTLASHILFTCALDGRSLTPRPCPCMLVRAAFNATTLYIQIQFISKYSSKAMFASLTWNMNVFFESHGSNNMFPVSFNGNPCTNFSMSSLI